MHSSMYFCLFLLFCFTIGTPEASSIFFRDEQRDAAISSANDFIPLKIGGFNIQVFGTKKMSKQAIKDILVKIILRYDILLVQEIRSTTDTAINELLKALNSASRPKNIYSMKLSKRLGRTSSKEQYAFLYRRDKVQAIGSYVYTEIAGKDAFQREPYIVKFRAPHAYLKEFVLAAIHTQPSAAPSEIDHLVDVYDDIVKRFSTKDVMILGDFNAGCSYVTNSEWKKIRLATDHRFYWLFTNDEDTTVSKSDCPYDRMVVAGEMIKAIIPKSEKVYNFANAYHLTQKEAELVSDHWIIEAQLKDESYLIEENNFKSKIMLTVIDKRNEALTNKRLIYQMRSSRNPLSQLFISSTSYKRSGAIAEISLTKKAISFENAKFAVEQLGMHLPKFVPQYQVIISTRKLNNFMQKIAKACQVEKSMANEFQYQVIGDGSCSHNFKIDSVTLKCNTDDLICQLDFLFV